MCKVNGCAIESRYKEQDVCQKHYFRMMRNGSYELKDKLSYKKRKTKRKLKIYTPNGYAKLYKPNHDLAVDGYVFEHRYVFYSINKGKKLTCEMCKKDWSWRPYYDHVDHIDNDKLNNDPGNLRALCNSCNTGRTKRNFNYRQGAILLTYKGETKTASEWARDYRVNLSHACIRHRKQIGWSDHDCLFKEKITHKYKRTVSKSRRY